MTILYAQSYIFNFFQAKYEQMTCSNNLTGIFLVLIPTLINTDNVGKCRHWNLLGTTGNEGDIGMYITQVCSKRFYIYLDF